MLTSRAVVREDGLPAGLWFSASRRSIGLVGAGIVLAALGFALAWNMAIWPLNQGSAKALAHRAQYFWDLRIAGDSMGAYDYMVETYRRRVDPNGFAKAGGIVVWTKADVKDVTLDEKGGLVDIEIRYRVAKRGMDLETSNIVRERWVVEDGEWRRWPPELGG